MFSTLKKNMNKKMKIDNFKFKDSQKNMKFVFLDNKIKRTWHNFNPEIIFFFF